MRKGEANAGKRTLSDPEESTEDIFSLLESIAEADTTKMDVLGFQRQLEHLSVDLRLINQ